MFPAVPQLSEVVNTKYNAINWLVEDMQKMTKICAELAQLVQRVADRHALDTQALLDGEADLMMHVYAAKALLLKPPPGNAGKSAPPRTELSNSAGEGEVSATNSEDPKP